MPFLKNDAYIKGKCLVDLYGTSMGFLSGLAIALGFLSRSLSSRLIAFYKEWWAGDSYRTHYPFA